MEKDPSAQVRRWLLALPDLDSTFAQLDTNRDGLLSLDQLHTVLQPVTAQCLLQLADNDGNGKIDLRELHDEEALVAQGALR